MKNFIVTPLLLLSLESLHAQSMVDSDIIIPKSLQSEHQIADKVESQITLSEEYLENSNQQDTGEYENIIIPQSFKKSTINNENNLNLNTQEEPLVVVQEPKELVEHREITDNDIDTPPIDYSGYYKFTQGSDSFRGMFEKINDGYLVIEKLDENDFGFYYVIQSKEFPPNEKYGIFHYKNGRFFQKFIDDLELRDNVKLKGTEYAIETTIETNKGTQSIQWEKSYEEDISTLNSKLQEALKLTKENYRQIYKERFKN